MSYCVNCGVELDKTADKCVLCGTCVVNPTCEVDRVSPKPYASAIATLLPIYHRVAAFILGMSLASINIVCIVINLLVPTNGMWWVIVAGISVLIWVSAGFPLLTPGLSKYIYVLIITGALAGNMVLIGLFSGYFGWVFRLAIPIVLFGAFLVLTVMFLKNRFKLRLLGTYASISCVIGAYSIGIELFIDLFVFASVRLSWSVIVMACCVSIMFMLLALSKTKTWKEEAKKRLRM
ncbi:MAG: DUF6320 domain-containing protein [Eubacteriales bacterium]